MCARKDTSLCAEVMVAMVTNLQDGLQTIPAFRHLQAVLSPSTMSRAGWEPIQCEETTDVLSKAWP